MKKHQYIRRVAVSLVVLMVVVVFVNAPRLMAHEVSLDGKTYIGEIGKKGEKKGEPDNFIFRKGRFRSSACDKYGFGDAAYKAHKVFYGSTIKFETETHNDRGAVMKWKGTVKGDKLEGKATLVRKGKPNVENWFSGELK